MRDGDEWVINGHKWFTTNASSADIILVFAETNPEGRPHKHASIFIVPAGTPGMDVVRDIGTMAHPEPEYGRPGNHAEVVFRDCRVPADHLIGAPGDGFVLAQQRLGGGRIHHSMRWLGQAQRSLDIMCERAVSRSSHGKLLGQHQMVQDYIALSHMEIQAARLLTFQTAWKMDKYGSSAVRADLGMIKAHVSKVVLAVLDRTIQVCGALGYSSDLPVEEWYRGTRFGPIGDGPDELHKSVLARTLLKKYKPVDGLADRAHPEPAPCCRGQVGGAAGGRGGGVSSSAMRRSSSTSPAPCSATAICATSICAQLRFVADAIGVQRSDAELRAAYRDGDGRRVSGGRVGAVLPAFRPVPDGVRRDGRAARRIAGGGGGRRGAATPVRGHHRRSAAAAGLPGDARAAARRTGSICRSCRTSTTS